MLEMLYAFSIFLLIVSFLPLSFKYLFQNDQFDARTQIMEWHVFVNQLKKEMRGSEVMDVSNERIALRRNGQVILYERYGTNIRRRVDFKGHEIVLQQVGSLQFFRIKNGVKLTVKDLFNQSHASSLYSYIELEEEYGP
ncbi:ComGF family competence protein [Bacillus sp. FJAT-29790]|nr:ComGF family competence protein [Bacillus sp. FJAT-29790]